MAQQEVERRRVALRLHPDLHERVKYWADKEGVSINEWIMSAIEGQIARANGDYDLPTAEIARLNQLVDGYESMVTGFGNLERVVVSMSDSIVGLARGESYLMDSEEGELAG